jgi:hypothetical protein
MGFLLGLDIALEGASLHVHAGLDHAHRLMHLAFEGIQLAGELLILSADLPDQQLVGLPDIHLVPECLLKPRALVLELPLPISELLREVLALALELAQQHLQVSVAELRLLDHERLSLDLLSHQHPLEPVLQLPDRPLPVLLLFSVRLLQLADVHVGLFKLLAFVLVQLSQLLVLGEQQGLFLPAVFVLDLQLQCAHLPLLEPLLLNRRQALPHRLFKLNPQLLFLSLESPQILV